MNPVEADHFKHYKLISRLRLCEGTPAFLLKQANLEKNCYGSDLWLLQKNTPLRLTTSGNVAQYWWQNAASLLFTHSPSSNQATLAKETANTPTTPHTILYQICTTTPSEIQEFLRLPFAAVEDIAFLPDGRLLFIALYEPGNASLPVGTGSFHSMPSQASTCEIFTELPFWADSEGFTSGKRHRLYLYDAGTITPITDETTDVSELRLSPSASHVFFLARRFETKAPVDDRLMRLSLSSFHTEDLTICPTFLHGAYAVLDDNTLLLFGSDMASHGLHQNGSFYRLEISSGHITPLYENGEYSDWMSVATDLKTCETSPWLFCNGLVYWVSSRFESSQLFCINPKSGKILQLTHEEGAVLEFAVSEERIYFTAMREFSACELYTLTPDGDELCHTDFNKTIREKTQFSLPEPLSFTNVDTVEIKGWAMRPISFELHREYPCILAIHGGPKAIFSSVLFHELQYFASCGFGVLFCNPTGSDGRGDAFADIRGCYGLADYQDILGFVDTALARHSWIDPVRLGIIGDSYGGFLTNWAIGHTTRFAAAVSERGIANWTTMATLSDIGYYFVPDQTGADPWGDIDTLWEQSPLKYANHIITPTLFIHGAEDRRCPPAESMQMYNALQTFGVETRLCLFEGESHELSRSGKPHNRVRRLQEILHWFEKHLKAD